MVRVFFPAAALLLMAAPALAQSSWPTTNAAAPAPASGITLGIAAAATANDRPAGSSASGTIAKSGPAVAANTGTGRLRASTR